MTTRTEPYCTSVWLQTEPRKRTNSKNQDKQLNTIHQTSYLVPQKLKEHTKKWQDLKQSPTCFVTKWQWPRYTNLRPQKTIYIQNCRCFRGIVAPESCSSCRNLWTDKFRPQKLQNFKVWLLLCLVAEQQDHKHTRNQTTNTKPSENERKAQTFSQNHKHFSSTNTNHSNPFVRSSETLSHNHKQFSSIFWVLSNKIILI